jgi:hypothetical protein
MAVFPLQVFTKENAPVAFGERYKSSPLGIKYAGQPKGVYIGLVTSTAGPILTLSPDSTHGYSLIKLPSRGDPSGLDIVVTNPIQLDFSAQPDVDFPLLVVARASYFDDPDRTTSATLVTRSGSVSSIDDDEVLVCVVNGPAATISVLSDPAQGERDSPLAFSGVDFGFMPGGAIEDLQAAADIVGEVVAARVGLDSTAHDSLSARIAEDYGAASMASRLALVFRALRSNDYSVTAGDQEIIVSGSFTEVDRDFEPAITLGGLGSETEEGVIAGPNDDTRNIVMLVDATTGYRPIDNALDRRTVFGRIVGPNQSPISGEWQFLNASLNVTASDGNGQATVEVETGDSVLGPDGKFYEVDSVTGDNSLLLRTAYQGASETIAPSSIQRWTLSFKRLNSGAEEDVSYPADGTVRFFFPTFVSMERGNADWRLAMHTAAEREPLPEATTTAPGRVTLADGGALLGAVNIQSAGTPLTGGPFHTIKFSAVEANVQDVAPGEVSVIEIGPDGLKGLDGPSGGAGNPGATGPGYSQLNPFEPSNEFSFPGITPPTVFSFTQNMGHNIRYLHGDIARYRDFGYFSGNGVDRYVVSGIEQVSATEGQIDGTIAGDTALIVFLSSAGD